ncbi:MAG: LysM peptidoglycan-binding domain-containing protein [Christensenellaceae bacterium]|jgi:hypothetical protein|nr:LysM peptidoglycan-binding domain-containing protein [Christensenellaceae bacterium]
MPIRCDRRELIRPVRLYLDQDISISDAKEIVFATAKAQVSSVDILAGEARISYKIEYDVVYSSQDKTDVYSSTYERNATLKNTNMMPGQYAHFTTAVVSTEHAGVANLKMRVEIEISGYTIIEKEINLPEIADNINVKYETVDIDQVLPIKDGNFNLEREFDVKEGISKILLADTQSIVKESNILDGICALTGESYTYITYLSDGNLSSRCFTVPWNFEVPVDSSAADVSACWSVSAEDTLVTLFGETAENEADSIKIRINFKTNGYLVNNYEINFPVDAYSVSHELEIKNNISDLFKNICTDNITEKVSGIARITEDRTRIRSILAISPPTVGATVMSNDNGLMVEGILTSTIAYLNGEDEVASILAEIPYNFILDKDFPQNAIELSSNAVINSISAKARHNDEIEVVAEININVLAMIMKKIEYIASVKDSNPLTAGDVAISLYIAKKGETMWDVAKVLRVSIEDLMRLNPELKYPFTGGERVIVYRALND